MTVFSGKSWVLIRPPPSLQLWVFFTSHVWVASISPRVFMFPLPYICELYLSLLIYTYSHHLTRSLGWSKLGYQNSKELGRVSMKGNRLFNVGHMWAPIILTVMQSPFWRVSAKGGGRQRVKCAVSFLESVSERRWTSESEMYGLSTKWPRAG